MKSRDRAATVLWVAAGVFAVATGVSFYVNAREAGASAQIEVLMRRLLVTRRLLVATLALGACTHDYGLLEGHGLGGGGGNVSGIGGDGAGGSSAPGGRGGAASGTGGTLGTAGTGGDGATGGAGAAGTTGVAGNGGATGSAGTGGTGNAGTGGRGGTTGAAGTTGNAGRGGTTGVAGTSGSGGTTGSAGRGGTSGTAGTGGDTGTGPCTGYCSNPISVPPNMNSGELGAGATCHQVVGTVAMGQFICGNFIPPRTFTVNNVSFDCTSSVARALPAPRNGGWCMRASAGDYPYAYFTTY